MTRATASVGTRVSGRAARQAIRPRWLLATVAAWIVCGLLGVFFAGYLNTGIHGVDAHAYWLTAHRPSLYGAPPGSRDAYLYSPVFALVISPLAHLPWAVFLAVWMLAELAVFGWLLAPVGVRWGAPLMMLCLIEVNVGNVYSFFALVAVVGLSRPAAWAFPLLTKITPGLGPVWFAASRQWRACAISLGSTAAIAAVSIAVAPGQWAQWLHFLGANAGGGQWLFPVRVGGAVALTVVGAVKGKPWVLAPAMLLANPVVAHSWMDLTLLAAIPRLRSAAAPARRHRAVRPIAQRLAASRPRGLRAGALRDRGAVVVEAAVITPLFLTVVIGIIEFGSVYKDQLAITSAVRAGARMASSEPRVATFATDAVNQVAREGSALTMANIQSLWVYKADSGGYASGSDFTSCPSATCDQFTWSPATSSFVQSSGTWVFTNQDACTGEEDSVGIYLAYRHPSVTQLFFTTLTLTSHTVMVLEPIPAMQSGGCK